MVSGLQATPTVEKMVSGKVGGVVSGQQNEIQQSGGSGAVGADQTGGQESENEVPLEKRNRIMYRVGAAAAAVVVVVTMTLLWAWVGLEVFE